MQRTGSNHHRNTPKTPSTFAWLFGWEQDHALLSQQFFPIAPRDATTTSTFWPRETFLPVCFAKKSFIFICEELKSEIQKWKSWFIFFLSVPWGIPIPIFLSHTGTRACSLSIWPNGHRPTVVVACWNVYKNGKFQEPVWRKGLAQQLLDKTSKREPRTEINHHENTAEWKGNGLLPVCVPRWLK